LTDCILPVADPGAILDVDVPPNCNILSADLGLLNPFDGIVDELIGMTTLWLVIVKLLTDEKLTLLILVK
jgi:hypothetical protein